MEHVAAISPPSHPSLSLPLGHRRVQQAGGKQSQGVPGLSSRHFPCDYSKIFSVKVFTGWVGLFCQSQILADQFSVRSF